MPTLNLQTQDEVVAAAAAAIQANATQAPDMSVGSTMLAMVEAAAGLYLWLQYLCLTVLSAARLATSSGSDCDSFGADYGFTRLPGVASGGAVQFARYTVGTIAVVPVGTLVKTSDGTQSFSVIADSTNSAWMGTSVSYPNGYYQLGAGVASIGIPVLNTMTGSLGNILADQIGLVATALPGIDTVINPAAFTNGVNAESDAAYKARFGLWLISLAKGTSVAVQSAAEGVQLNLSCAVLNCVAVIGGPPQPGYAVIAVDDGSGATPQSTLAAVAGAAASQSVIPLGAVVTTVQAAVIQANVVMTITCANSAIKAATIPLVQAAIASYIGSLNVATVPASGAPANNALAYGRLYQLAFDASQNVLDVTGLTLNGGMVDIGGSPGTVVRAGVVTVD